MKKLSALAIPSLPPGDYPDPIVTGLFLRVGAKRKSWMLRYYQGKERRKLVIGYWLAANPPPGSDHVGLADARTKAKEIVDRVTIGAPVTEPAPVHPKTGSMTVEQLINAYEKQKAKAGGRGSKSLPEAMRAVRSGLEDFMKVEAKQFSKNDLRAARDAIAERGKLQMSDRFLSYAGPMFRWALTEDHIDVDHTPAVIKIGPKLVVRERTLTHDEIRKIWAACGKMETEAGRNYGRLVKFLLCTGQRRGEGAALKHGDIIDKRWRFRVKGNKDHMFPLPQLALDQIGEGAADALVFLGEGGKAISGWSKYKTRLDELAGIGDWRHHDLRRTCATAMEEDLDIDAATIHATLGHQKSGLTKTYLKGKLSRQVGEALEIWNNHLAGILAKKPASAQA